MKQVTRTDPGREIVFRRIRENPKRYLSLLLLADEQESMIDRYLSRGEMTVLEIRGEVLGEIVVTDEGSGVLEIKSLAVAPTAQRRGYGRALVEHARRAYADRYSTLRVGTGDSPLTVPFYERCGFVRAGVIPDFFTEHYAHPIVEAGVLLRDMVILERPMNTNIPCTQAFV